MASSNEYTNEQLNYFRICHVTTNILADGLRTIFKQEWDKQYKATMGEWKDEPRNGQDFYNGESLRNRRKNAHLLATMKNGDRTEWDCTMLFYAILYSDCVGHGINATVRTNVDNLRKFRNEAFAHSLLDNLSDKDFHKTISNVCGAFQVLGLDTVKIQDIKNQTTFPTEELRDVLKQVDNLKQQLQVKEDQQQLLEDQRQVLEDQLQKEITSFCILPPKPSHDIGTRDRDVAEIAKQLRELKEANESSLTYLYISGNPGSGKSQLASLVAKRFFDEVKEIPCGTPFVMTLNAASPDSFLESYAFFARQLRCPEYSIIQILHSKNSKIDEKIADLKMLISTKIGLYTSWLLVVDNVTSVSSVHVHLPDSGNEAWGKGQLLITTQDTASIPLPSSSINHIPVSKGMDHDDAISLLSMLSGLPNSEQENEVAQALDYQPLALASAATFVKQARQNKASSHFGWKEYLKVLEKGQRRITEEILAETNLSYPNSMTAAIALAVEKEITFNKVVYHLFSLLSICAPKPLSLDIGISYIKTVDENSKDLDKELICMRLKRCSLLLFDEDENGCFIRVHQVVHDAIKTALKNNTEDDNIEIMNGAIKSFNQFINTLPQESHSALGTLHVVPHLRNLLFVIDDVFSKESSFQVHDKYISSNYYQENFHKFGCICLEHCEFNGAKIYHEYALALKLEKLGTTDLAVATSYSYLGSIHQDLGDLEQAKEYTQRALTITLERLGAEHIDVATSYNNLGSIHQDLGDLEQAKEYQQRALTITLERLGAEHIDVATSYNNLALIHQDLGDLEQAKEYQQRALTIRLERLGAEHIDVAKSYNNLASIHRDLGDLEQAKEYTLRALTITLERLGAEHIVVATSYNNLGSIHYDLGDLEQAKEYTQRALTIRLERLGAEHIVVARSYNNLGSIHRRLGDLEEAKEYQQRALTITLERLGAEHIDVATSYNNLGLIHQDLGDLEEAKEYQQRALTIRLERLGAGHIDVATSYNNLGSIHQDLGDLEQAKEYQQRALTIRLERLGAEHIDVATSYNNLGSIHQDLGDLEQAKEYQQRALTIRLERLGAEHIDVATSYNNLGSIHQDLGDLEQAKEYQQRALTIRLERLGAEHIDVARSYNNLGSIHWRLGDLEQAKEYTQRALTIRLERLGAEHIDVARSYKNLASIHLDLGDLEQAKEYQQRALTITLERLGAEHIDVATSYNNLGLIHRDLGDLEQAKEHLQRALTIRLEKLGAEHIDVARSYNNLGLIHLDLGELEQAKECQQSALTIRLERLGADLAP